MFFLENLIGNIKQGAYILAGCMVLRGHAPDVCMKKILNFGHCMCIYVLVLYSSRYILSVYIQLDIRYRV